MRLSFDSDVLPSQLDPREKARCWAEAMEAQGVGFEVAASKRGFSAKLECVLLGDVHVTSASATSLRVVRTKRKIEQDRDDRFNLLFGLGPKHLLCSQNGREFTLAPGDACILDHGQPNVSGAPLGGEAIAVMLPRHSLGQSTAALEAAMSRPLDARSGPFRLLAEYAHTIAYSSTPMDRALAQAAAVHLADLAVLGISGPREERRLAERRGLQAVRQRMVLAEIAKRCSEPGLTARDVGAALGISERYVQHLLAETERNFSQELNLRRVELAHAGLVAPAPQPQSVMEIALACGFSDLSTFYRAFRARYGYTPSDARKLADRPQ